MIGRVIKFVARRPHGHTARVAEAFGTNDRLVRVVACGESDRVDVLTNRYGLVEKAHFSCEEAEALAVELLEAVRACRAARHVEEVAA